MRLQHGLERLIDSFAEGLIDKEQFTSRMTRAKSRIAELDAEISVDSGDADHRDRMRGLAIRLRELAATVGRTSKTLTGSAGERLFAHPSSELR